MKTFKEFMVESVKVWKDAVKKEHGDDVVFSKSKKTDRYSSARDEAHVGDEMIAYREKDGRQFIMPAKKVNEDLELDEAIKGWKNAHSDIMKQRQTSADAKKEHKLVSLKKDGTESKMSTATKVFGSEEEATRHHNNMKQFNPGKKIEHNYYVGGELKGKLD